MPADQDRADAAYYRRVLHGLIDAGAELAAMVHAQAKVAVEAAALSDEGGAVPLAEAAVAFDRLSRCVRRSIALAQRVAEPVTAAGADARRVVGRRLVLRDVEDAIRRNAADAESETGLNAELHERLDDADLDVELDVRPMLEIARDIRRDLGLEPRSGGRPWKRRMPEDVRVLYARAAGEAVDAPAFVARPWFRVGPGMGGAAADERGDLGALALALTGAVGGCGPP